MAGSFASDTYNVAALLGRTSFPHSKAQPIKVPPFQRSYSWERTHVATFWDDVLAFHQQRNVKGAYESYFLGPIVILERDHHVDILDGQQRLATITILLAVIRDMARSSGGQPGADLARDIQRDYIMVDDADSIRALTLSDLDDAYYRAMAQNDPPNPEPARLRSHRLMQGARTYLAAQVNELCAASNDPFVKQLKELTRTVSTHLKLVTITVQSEEEAFLIFETLNDRGLRLSVPDLLLNHLMRKASNSEDREAIRDDWNRVIENLGQRKVSTFVRHMWVSKYGDVKTQGLFREIRDNLNEKNVTSLSFARLCADESDKYGAIIRKDKSVLGESGEANVSHLIDDLGSDRSLPLLLSSLVCMNQADFEKLSKAALSVITRHSVFTELNPLQLESKLYEAARAVRNEHDQSGTSSKCLAAAKRVLQEVNPQQEQLNLEEVYLTKKQARYVVLALCQKLQSTTNAVEMTRNSIEHIFPGGAQLDSWPNRELLEPYIWHLGNLVMLENTYNRDIGNQAFSVKIDYYKRSEIEAARRIGTTYPSWGVDEILERAKGFKSLARQIWPDKL